MKPLVPLILLIALVMSGCAEKPKTVEKVAKKPVVFTISPETTYLTEPLLPDGRIDYLAALNEKMSAQTTPENNLLVGFFSLILGEMEVTILRDNEAKEEQQKYRERFWKMLGLDAPPPIDSLVEVDPLLGWWKKNYREKLREFYSEEDIAPLIEGIRERERRRLKTRLEGGVSICCGRETKIAPDGITKEKYEAELKRIETETPEECYREIVQNQWYQESMARPWTAEEFPYLAHWIRGTDEWTPKLIDLSRQRTGFYHPQISESTLFYEVQLTCVQSLRWVARFFQARGNWEFAQGNLDQAMECPFSTIRIARTTRKGACWIVEDLVGIAMHGMGNYQLTRYLTFVKVHLHNGYR